MVTSPIRRCPPATSKPAMTVRAARPTFKITDWAPFSRFSEELARALASTYSAIAVSYDPTMRSSAPKVFSVS